MMPAGKGVVPPLLAAGDALYLDFDGTLTDIAPRPDAVVVPQPLPGLLIALRARLGGAVAVVTGRRLDDIDGHLAPLRLPGAGLHGAQLRLSPRRPARQRRVRAIPEIARTLTKRYAADPRVLVEDKGASVALHFRAAPERAAECTAALGELAAAHGLDVVEGKMVVEARPRDVDKGAALRTLAAHAPFAGRRPVFVGDDVTDEAAFLAAQADGGFGIKVGSGETAAQYRCAGVGDVHAWLRASLTALERTQYGRPR